MAPAFDTGIAHGLNDALVLSLLSTGLSSAAMYFVLIMWFDLMP